MITKENEDSNECKIITSVVKQQIYKWPYDTSDRLVYFHPFHYEPRRRLKDKNLPPTCLIDAIYDNIGFPYFPNIESYLRIHNYYARKGLWNSKLDYFLTGETKLVKKWPILVIMHNCEYIWLGLKIVKSLNVTQIDKISHSEDNIKQFIYYQNMQSYIRLVEYAASHQANQRQFHAISVKFDYRIQAYSLQGIDDDDNQQSPKDTLQHLDYI